MKTRFVCAILMIAVFGLASCNNSESNEPTSVEKGNLKFTYTLPQSLETKAASTMKPTTTWADNIKSLLMLFVDATGVIKDSRIITPPTATDNSQQSTVLTSVIAGNNYTIYLIANYDQTGADIAWIPTSVNGSSFSSLLMKLVATPAATWTDKSTTVEGSTTAYDEAAEIFIASLTGVNVVQDVTTTHSTPLVLKRAVSLFRARINPTSLNSSVNFGDANASLRIRRVANTVTPSSVYTPATPVNTSMTYSKGFLNADPTTGYTTGFILDAGLGQTHWKDVRILPGGHDTKHSEMFDIVISGLAPSGYVTLDGTTLAAAQLVYWTGVVEKAVVANNILEITANLTGKGLPSVPGVEERGNIEFDLRLLEWGAIESVETNM